LARIDPPITGAKLPLAKDIKNFDFADTPVDPALIRKLAGVEPRVSSLCRARLSTTALVPAIAFLTTPVACLISEIHEIVCILFWIYAFANADVEFVSAGCRQGCSSEMAGRPSLADLRGPVVAEPKRKKSDLAGGRT
jgi:hypothetical protein